jgi:hypothetical protein
MAYFSSFQNSCFQTPKNWPPLSKAAICTDGLITHYQCYTFKNIFPKKFVCFSSKYCQFIHIYNKCFICSFVFKRKMSKTVIITLAPGKKLASI